MTSEPPPSTNDAVRLARKIAETPTRELPAAIGEMMFKRDLYRTVTALDDLITDHPEHRQVAVRALERLGLWCGG
jgi:hypothetical protein